MTGSKMYKVLGSDYWFYCEWKSGKRKSKYRKCFAKRFKKHYRQLGKRSIALALIEND